MLLLGEVYKWGSSFPFPRDNIQTVTHCTFGSGRHTINTCTKKYSQQVETIIVISWGVCGEGATCWWNPILVRPQPKLCLAFCQSVGVVSGGFLAFAKAATYHQSYLYHGRDIEAQWGGGLTVRGAEYLIGAFDVSKSESMVLRRKPMDGLPTPGFSIWQGRPLGGFPGTDSLEEAPPGKTHD